MRIVLAVSEQNPKHATTCARLVDQGHTVIPVWCGQPSQHPTTRLNWAHPTPPTASWGLLRLAHQLPVYEWLRILTTLTELPSEPTITARLGAWWPAGNIEKLVPETGVGMAKRPSNGIRPDGQFPNWDDYAHHSGVLTSALGFATPSAALVAPLIERLIEYDPIASYAPGFATAILDLDTTIHTVEVPALAWGNTDLTDQSAGIDVSVGLGTPDDDEWWNSLVDGRQRRNRLAATPTTWRVLEQHRDELPVDPSPQTLPGAIPFNPALTITAARGLAAHRLDGAPLPPCPEFRPADFRSWLATPEHPWMPRIGRYWIEQLWQHPDLTTDMMPGGDLTTLDLPAFIRWAEATWTTHHHSQALLNAIEITALQGWESISTDPGGVNLVGYHCADVSFQIIISAFRRGLDATGVPVASVNYSGSGSPPLPNPPVTTNELRYDTNLIVFNPDQLLSLDNADRDALLVGRRNIGWWAWDVELVPDWVREAARLLDEVWVATAFTADKLNAVLDVPVRAVCPPHPEPQTSTASRTDLAMPDRRFVFLVVLDHLSVTERKNPIAAIEAFRRAFPEPSSDGPVLIVKTRNASHRPYHHDRVHAAAIDRPDITIVDANMSRADAMAMLHSADCLVSLHRSEGLGLHLLEAMWLRTPTIATRYSGNLAFMDDSNSHLIDASLTPVVHGEGYFPAEAKWAQPNLDQAATAMRTVVAERDEPMIEAAHAWVTHQPSPEAFGRLVADLLQTSSEEHR